MNTDLRLNIGKNLASACNFEPKIYYLNSKQIIENMPASKEELEERARRAFKGKFSEFLVISKLFTAKRLEGLEMYTPV